jgi:two-component system, chemotaxis family, chemotaxis protein CheY
MGCTCLVVDDSRVIRRYARVILEANGYTVTEAENGRIALEDCRRAQPDCVLLDWNMPVMNGIEFLRALRREFGPDRPIVVFCTAQAEMTAIEQAMESGAQEYIMKPFDAGILLGKFAQVGLG